MRAIEAKGIIKRFGDVVAVDDVDLAVERGEIFGLLGPNGAGKTTIIKILTTLLPPTSGSVYVAGFDVCRQAAEVRGAVAYVPQLVSADGGLTAAENLRLFARLYGVPRSQIPSRVEEALHFVGLERASNRLVRTYSGGMVRRLEIALALIHRPRVLFLDEPTVGLDPLARQAVWQQVQKLASEFNTTVLLTTHFLDEADELCGRVAILSRGKVRALGSPEELKTRINSPDASLDDVLALYSGEQPSSETDTGDFRAIANSRKNAARLG